MHENYFKFAVGIRDNNKQLTPDIGTLEAMYIISKGVIDEDGKTKKEKQVKNLELVPCNAAMWPIDKQKSGSYL